MSDSISADTNGMSFYKFSVHATLTLASNMDVADDFDAAWSGAGTIVTIAGANTVGIQGDLKVSNNKDIRGAAKLQLNGTGAQAWESPSTKWLSASDRSRAIPCDAGSRALR